MREYIYSFLKFRGLLGAFTGFVFLLFPVFAFAFPIYPYIENSPNNLPVQFVWFIGDSDVWWRYTLASTTATDSFGNNFWFPTGGTIGSLVALGDSTDISPNGVPTTTPFNINFGTSIGRYIFAIGEFNDFCHKGGLPYFYWLYAGSGYNFSFCEENQATTTIDGHIINVRRFEKIPMASSSDIYSFTSSLNEKRLYAVFFDATPNFSWLDNPTSLTNFLNQLRTESAIFSSSTPLGLVLPLGTCEDMGTIAGAFCRVLTYLFYPNQETINQFSDLGTQLQNKPPFGYFASVKNAINNLNSTTSPVFTLTQASSTNDTIFTPFKTGLSWVLWILFGFWAIKRIGGFIF